MSELSVALGRGFYGVPVGNRSPSGFVMLFEEKQQLNDRYVLSQTARHPRRNSPPFLIVRQSLRKMALPQEVIVDSTKALYTTIHSK